MTEPDAEQKVKEKQTKKKHKQWRKEAKKLRRKKIRQKLAKQRTKLEAEEEAVRLKDPNYQKWLQQQDELAVHEREQEEHKRQEQEELWLRRELLARKHFREQQQKQEATEAAKEAERQRIQKEFEELQRKEQQRREERLKLEEQAKLEYETTMAKIADYMEHGGNLPEELKGNIQSNPSKELCQLFSKTNACRFGHFCTRNHIRPRLSRVLFIPNFFTHMKLEYGGTSHASDINLECSDEDLKEDYKTFFDDVIMELRVFGEIVNFRTCMNTQPHLRGNVLVEFASDRSALSAFVKLHGRVYGGKRIHIEFSGISSWRGALCGLFYTNSCPKGRACNFLHVFKNPDNLYSKPISLHNEIEDISKSSQRGILRESAVLSPNEVNSKSRRNWRWSETPEPRSSDDKRSSETRKKTVRDRERSRSHERHHRSQKSHRGERKSSSRSSSRNSHREESSSSSRNKRKKSRSRSSSRSRKYHDDDDDDRKKHYKKKERKHNKSKRDDRS